MTAENTDQQFRIEHDTMGEVKVPVNALYRAQTQRAVENFPISGRPMPRGFIRRPSGEVVQPGFAVARQTR